MQTQNSIKKNLNCKIIIPYKSKYWDVIYEKRSKKYEIAIAIYKHAIIR